MTSTLDRPSTPAPVPHGAGAPAPSSDSAGAAGAIADPADVTAAPAASAAAPAPYHRLALTLPRKHYWWRPLAAFGIFAVSYVLMAVALFAVCFGVMLAVPSLSLSESMVDARNPMDMLLGLGMIALFIPAVLLASRIAYGSAGMTHSVRGRFRWGLLGRAALVVAPVYVLLNIGTTVLFSHSAFQMPPLTAPVIAAWLIIVLMVPLQAAGEEYAFRTLPMQIFGTWLRSPLWGILIPVPLFMAGHGYHWVGQIDLAVFAIAMGLLAWKTGGLELPILMHVANNLTLFLITPFLPGALEQGAVPPTALLFSTLPTVLITVGLWWWYSRREGLGLWEPTQGALQRNR